MLACVSCFDQKWLFGSRFDQKGRLRKLVGYDFLQKPPKINSKSSNASVMTPLRPRAFEQTHKKNIFQQNRAGFKSESTHEELKMRPGFINQRSKYMNIIQKVPDTQFPQCKRTTKQFAVMTADFLRTHMDIPGNPWAESTQKPPSETNFGRMTQHEIKKSRIHRPNQTNSRLPKISSFSFPEKHRETLKSEENQMTSNQTSEANEAFQSNAESIGLLSLNFHLQKEVEVEKSVRIPVLKKPSCYFLPEKTVNKQSVSRMLQQISKGKKEKDDDQMDSRYCKVASLNEYL